MSETDPKPDKEKGKSPEVDNQRSTRIEQNNQVRPMSEGYQPETPVDTSNPPGGNPPKDDPSE